MDFITLIDWRTVLITLAAVLVTWNIFQLIRAIIRKKKADKELGELDKKIVDINRQLADTKKAFLDQIKKPKE